MYFNKRNCVILFQALIFAASFTSAVYFINLRLTWIFEFQYPPTTDGFFYLQEIKYRLQNNSGYYVSFSPFFSLISIFANLLNIKDEIFIYRTLVILSLLSFSISGAIFVGSKKNIWLLLAVFQIAWISDVLFFRHYAFVKQSASISFFLLGCSIYLNIAREKSSAKNILCLISCILIFVGVVTHLFTAAIFAGLLLFNFFAKSNLKKLNFALGTGIAVAVYWIGTLKEKKLFEFFPHKLELSWQTFCGNLLCYEFDYFEYYLYTGIFIYLIGSYIYRKNKDSVRLFFILGYLLLVLPIWNLESQFVYRAAFSSVWLILFAFFSQLKEDNILDKIALITVLTLMTTVYHFSTHLRVRSIYMPSEKLLEYKNLLQTWIPEDSFVLAPHTMQFKISYFLNRRSASQIGKEKYENTFVFSEGPPDQSQCKIISSVDEKIPAFTKCISIENRWRFYKK